MIKAKINNIQVLRGVAAASVVYFHTGFVFWRFRPVGAFGVPVFFVISGFIMAYLCSIGSKEFFKRRLIRILPLYWSFTLVIFIAAMKFPQLMDATRASLLELVKSLIFIPYTKSSGLMQPMLFLGWTLNYEMLFYSIIGGSLLLSKQFAIPLTVFFLIGVICISSCFASSSEIAWFYSQPVMLNFIMGVGIYYLYNYVGKAFCRKTRHFSVSLALISSVGLIVIEGLYSTAQTSLVYFGVYLCASLLVLSILFLSKGGWDSGSRTLILLGDASYALYLSHPYVVQFFNRIIARNDVLMLNTKHFWGMIVSLCISVLFAIAIHLWLERPVTRYLSTMLSKDHRRTRHETPSAATVSQA